MKICPKHLYTHSQLSNLKSLILLFANLQVFSAPMPFGGALFCHMPYFDDFSFVFIFASSVSIESCRGMVGSCVCVCEWRLSECREDDGWWVIGKNNNVRMKIKYIFEWNVWVWPRSSHKIFAPLYQQDAARCGYRLKIIFSIVNKRENKSRKRNKRKQYIYKFLCVIIISSLSIHVMNAEATRFRFSFLFNDTQSPTTRQQIVQQLHACIFMFRCLFHQKGKKEKHHMLVR